ncbi:hypothetical protein PG993_013055 [Apiospora rasikravindrae]|uniref:Uncharacterized protein n=1 Tax=Apiospora rasikravindrae TaxID=990691 RepID=A0ABR1RWP8_9PEZI
MTYTLILTLLSLENEQERENKHLLPLANLGGIFNPALKQSACFVEAVLKEGTSHHIAFIFSHRLFRTSTLLYGFLAALFEGVFPETLELIKAYGERVFEIPKHARANEHKTLSSSVFGSYTGVDVTSIWVELIDERKKAIAADWDHNESIPFSVAAAAAQQGIARTQLAEWDTSSRAWLQTADSVIAAKQTQLRLVPKNVELPKADESSVHPGVVTAWKNTLRTMKRLISGITQEVYDGSAILDLRSWHIYQNIIVFGSRNVEGAMDDALFSSRGALSLGCSLSVKTPTNGVSWFLTSLAESFPQIQEEHIELPPAADEGQASGGLPTPKSSIARRPICSKNTSMHLSFTNWERPLEEFQSGGNQDVEMALIESVLSVRERGWWISDVDVLPALRSRIIHRLSPQQQLSSCGHLSSGHAEPPRAHVTSIESWDELREFSAGNVVVRTNGNWLARLTVAAYLSQSAQRE